MLRTGFCTICFLLLSIITPSQNNGGGNLGAILDSDGKVKSGVNGSFDASGFSVNLDERGSPRFLQSPKPASPASVTFSPIGDTYGAFTVTTASTRCVLVKDGDIYIGGNFATAGRAVSGAIARWHEGEWFSLGSGFNGSVLTMVFIGSDLYAGGSFTKSGDITVNYIAKWNGTEWSALGSGVNSGVNSLATDGTNLFAGGYFTHAGALGVSYIAKWDGSAWSRLGNGASSDVKAVYYNENILYAGGSFTAIGGVAASKIAFWNGSAWAQVGTGILGVSSIVNSIKMHDGILYVGGMFSIASGNTSANITGWNGTEWIAMGGGLNGTCYSLCSDGTSLFVGGGFNSAGGVSSTAAARWNGTAWSSMGTELSNTVTGLFSSAGTVYLCGTFPQSFAIWNGSYSFEQTPQLDANNSTASVTSICVVGSDIYIGGSFTSVGGVPANNIAKWDGTAWTTLGSGVTTPFSYPAIQTLTHDGTNLYAGGYFTNAGGNSISFLAKWDGSSWSAIGGAPNEAVWDIEVSDGKVFISGFFTAVGEVPANKIAKYSDGVWHPFGDGLNGPCYDMALDGNTLYATGSFSNAGGISAAYIAKWNGSVWSALGSGFSGGVGKAVKFHDGKLYAGGEFTSAGGMPANRVAVWNGSSWSGLGTGLYTSALINAGVESLEAYGSDIYVGGTFLTAGGLSTKNLAKWNGTSWVVIGTGVNNIVRALCVQTTTGSMIYGGDFLVSNGNVFTQRIAKFTDSDNPLPVELVSFSGRLSGNAIHLKWQTATEVDNYGFEVERKTTKSDWLKIGFIDGHGTSNSPKYYAFSDNSVLSGEKYFYRLKQIDGDGSYTYSHTVEISASAITGYTLEQNYPNPFNPETVIRYSLPVQGNIRLEVFNTHGEKVAVLAEGFQESRVHSVVFSAEGLASGVYFYTLITGDKKLTRKMILLR